MSDEGNDNDKLYAPSPNTRKPPPLTLGYTPSPNTRKPPLNTLGYTPSPCRTVGLKRRSTGSASLHPNVDVIETKKRVKFDGGSATAAEDINPKPDVNEQTTTPKTVLEKRRKIEELKSELKNCDQHDLDQIQELSNKWLRVCQEALMALLSQLNQNQNSNLHTVEDIISNLGINPDLIHYSSSTQEFY